MVKTLAVYSNGASSQQSVTEVINLTKDEAARLFNEGKTDGLPVYTVNIPESGQFTVERNWDGTDSAEYWIAYLETLSVQPLTQTLIGN
jgi:hypothetical protein